MGTPNCHHLHFLRIIGAMLALKYLGILAYFYASCRKTFAHEWYAVWAGYAREQRGDYDDDEEVQYEKNAAFTIHISWACEGWHIAQSAIGSG
jgi:hypothetical protein